MSVLLKGLQKCFFKLQATGTVLDPPALASPGVCVKMQILGPTSDLRIRISDGGLAQGSVVKQILQIILKLILILIF